MTNIMGLLNHRPLLCLVTDRRRYAPDGSNEQQLESVVTMVGAAASAGVDLTRQARNDDDLSQDKVKADGLAIP
jgi:hypothetical protein